MEQAHVTITGSPGRSALFAARAQASGVMVGDAGPSLAADAAAAADLFGDNLPWCASRPALFSLLHASGVPLPEWATAASRSEAVAALHRIGLPLIVRPVHPGVGGSTLRVDHAPDIDLAYAKASRHGTQVLLQRMGEGDRYVADAVVTGGTVHPVAVSSVTSGPAPYLFPMALATPATMSHPLDRSPAELLQRVATALDAPSGPLSAGMIAVDGKLLVTDVCLAPGEAAFCGDLIRLASGYDYLGACARAVAGLPVEEPPAARQGAAVAWIPAHAGVVTGTEGCAKAREAEGVVEVVVTLTPGVELRHATDESSRDRTGYVVATGEDGAQALARATAAAGVIEILRRPAV